MALEHDDVTRPARCAATRPYRIKKTGGVSDNEPIVGGRQSSLELGASLDLSNLQLLADVLEYLLRVVVPEGLRGVLAAVLQARE